MKKFSTLAPILGLVTSALLSTQVFAAGLTVASAPALSLTPQNVVDSMCNAVNWLFYVLIVLSIIMVMIAGFNFATAGDDAEKVGKAKKMIVYAAIGILVALIAKGFPNLIGSLFSVGQNLSC